MSSTRDSESRVILGLWPIAGVTTVGVTTADAERTIRSAVDAGISCFDTAYSYGYNGESDRLLAPFLATKREAFRVISKVGQRWTPSRERVVDGRPETLKSDAVESLRRLRTSSIDLLMLHSPDPKLPLEDSAEALLQLKTAGHCREIGICNATEDERALFSDVAGCAAIQCPLNLLQRDTLRERIPAAAAAGSDVHVYWTLMKGLLAGAIGRDHQFEPGDSRPRYPIFQGQARENAHRVLDALQTIGSDHGRTVAQLTIGWALAQPGVTAALVGARRPEQIRETAASHPLPPELLQQVEAVALG